MTTQSDVIGEEETAATLTLLTEIACVMFQETKVGGGGVSRSEAKQSSGVWDVPARQLQRSHALIIRRRLSCQTKENGKSGGLSLRINYE